MTKCIPAWSEGMRKTLPATEERVANRVNEMVPMYEGQHVLNTLQSDLGPLHLAVINTTFVAVVDFIEMNLHNRLHCVNMYAG